MMDPSSLEKELEAYYRPVPTPEGYEDAWRAAVKREESQQMKKRKSPFLKIALPAAAALILVIGGITASNFMPAQKTVSASIGSYSASMKGVAAPGAVYNGAVKYSVEEDAALDFYVEEDREMPAPMAAASSAEAASGSLWNRPDAAGERKLVRTATVTMKTAAFDEDLKALQQLIESFGGYLEDYSQYGDVSVGRLRNASLTARVPSDQLDAFLNGTGNIGRVTERSESATDKTTEYYDNETRLNTLRAKMTRLTELLEQAQDVKDLLEIESEISETQYRIDSFETSQRSIDNSVNMSTVYLNLTEEKAAQVAQTEEITFGKRLASALRAGGEGFLRFLGNMLVFLALALPYLAIACGIGLVIWLFLRARRKNGRHEETVPEKGPEKEAN